MGQNLGPKFGPVLATGGGWRRRLGVIHRRCHPSLERAQSQKHTMSSKQPKPTKAMAEKAAAQKRDRLQTETDKPVAEDAQPEPALKTQKMKPMSETVFLVVDAREPGEPMSYLRAAGPQMPSCIVDQLEAGRNTFEHIYFGDGIDGLNGLISNGAGSGDEDYEEYADELEEETNAAVNVLEQWIEGIVKPENKVSPPVSFDAYFSLAQA